MNDVFISYAREDGDAAAAMAAELEARGLSVFVDRTIPSGDSFESVIEQELETAGAVIVLWSEDSVKSEWVRAEAAAAAERGVLVPASLDGASPPLRYRLLQTGDLSAWEPGQTIPTFEDFISDVADRVAGNVVARPISREGFYDDDDHAPSQAVRWIPGLLAGFLAFAWLGSVAVSIVLAHDYGLVETLTRLFGFAYKAAYLSLIIGGSLSVILGAISFGARFIPGVLQGWVWPVLAGFGQILVLLATRRLFASLPEGTQVEAVLAFILAGSLAPALLTVAGIRTLRELQRFLAR